MLLKEDTRACSQCHYLIMCGCHDFSNTQNLILGYAEARGAWHFTCRFNYVCIIYPCHVHDNS